MFYLSHIDYCFSNIQWTTFISELQSPQVYVQLVLLTSCLFWLQKWHKQHKAKSNLWVIGWLSSEVNFLDQASNKVTYSRHAHDILTSALDSLDQVLWEKHLSGCYSLKHRATAVCDILYRFLQCLHLRFAATQKKVLKLLHCQVIS